jgi:hypothetical protein
MIILQTRSNDNQIFYTFWQMVYSRQLQNPMASFKFTFNKSNNQGRF